jgi:hypothetical protein
MTASAVMVIVSKIILGEHPAPPAFCFFPSIATSLVARASPGVFAQMLAQRGAFARKEIVIKITFWIFSLTDQSYTRVLLFGLIPTFVQRSIKFERFTGVTGRLTPDLF